MPSARFYHEREQLALGLDEVIRGCLSADRVPVVNGAAEDVFGEYAIGTFPERHEMRFFLGDLSAFTPRLVNALRGLAADQFPKWSVVPQFDTHVFTITAKAVVFRDRVVRGAVDDRTPAYVEWLAAAREYDAKRYGPIREQLQYLRPRLSDALRAAGGAGLAVAGAFDFYVPHFWGGNPVVWLVVGPALAETGVEVEAGSVLRTSALTASGFVFPEYTRRFGAYTDEPPAGRLVTIEFGRSDQGRLTLKGSDGRLVGPIVVSRIMTQKELGSETT
ncbi:hypothetical protein [Frigoriglobus tundricola]|uniref:Uncharacterized protein n=1 Tax=Frigoriglobus tundricola TaxID=2774151 RepID=A0A6M5YND7_9BACT|nr:hypothetical protein [Frigoriglobus tundricola]QJW95438.1 hypothetical protein FTUN_2987 [Frigoriglobus tundricola]